MESCFSIAESRASARRARASAACARASKDVDKDFVLPLLLLLPPLPCLAFDLALDSARLLVGSFEDGEFAGGLAVAQKSHEEHLQKPQCALLRSALQNGAHALNW